MRSRPNTAHVSNLSQLCSSASSESSRRSGEVREPRVCLPLSAEPDEELVRGKDT